MNRPTTLQLWSLGRSKLPAVVLFASQSNKVASKNVLRKITSNINVNKLNNLRRLLRTTLTQSQI